MLVVGVDDHSLDLRSQPRRHFLGSRGGIDTLLIWGTLHARELLTFASGKADESGTKGPDPRCVDQIIRFKAGGILAEPAVGLILSAGI